MILMKKIFFAFVTSLLSVLPSVGQITGVELARSGQKEELMTHDND